MFARLFSARKAAARIFALLSLIWLAACEPIAGVGAGTSGPAVNSAAPVQVALLVPGASGDSADGFLAQNLENAARLAIADLNGVRIDLRVYNTGATQAQAADAATRAANDGAMIILGPLRSDATAAVGVAVAGRDINVLSFSNTPTIAGGNVFILGQTFGSTARRLVQYSVANGLSKIMVVHGDDTAGTFGRDAIAGAIRASGGTLAGIQSYPLTQAGIQAAAPGIAAAVNASGAQAIFLTAGVSADLPIVATALPEAGIDPANVRYIGLTRWNAAPQALALPGLQGGLFALPDRATTASFETRYSARYGSTPHPLAGLAYDGIAAIGALVSSGRTNALGRAALTQSQGFQGTGGIFRLLPNGLNERGLAVAQIQNSQVVVLDPAPRSFGRAGL